ncbi:MAG: hypothetical protein HUU16_02985 [Candidatus Omnitrophica bacterium]|nr:hypothetical protein [Candidatus Omnitrophota bacterium]
MTLPCRSENLALPRGLPAACFATSLWAAWILGTVGLMEALRAYAPALLWRDQSQTAWHLTDQAWKTLGETPYGAEERKAALEKALPLFKRAAELSPRGGQYQLNVARTLHELRRFEEAYRETLAALPKCDPSDPAPWSLAGDLAVRLGLWREAEPHLRKALELDSSRSQDRERLARALLGQARVGEGIDLWQERLDRYPASSEDRQRAAQAAAAHGRFDKTVEWYREPLTHGALTPVDLDILAVARAALGDLEGSAEALNQSAALRGTPWAILPEYKRYGLPDLDPETLGRLKKALEMAREKQTKK